MQITTADLRTTFTLTFDRAALEAAGWDMEFIFSYGYEAEGEDGRSFEAMVYEVQDGRVNAYAACRREDAQGLVHHDRYDQNVSDRQALEDIESCDAAAAARIKLQREALALLEGRDLTPGRSNTLADMAAEIRSLRELGDAGRLAAALIADALHEDEREAGLAMAGVRL